MVNLTDAHRRSLLVIDVDREDMNINIRRRSLIPSSVQMLSSPRVRWPQRRGLSLAARMRWRWLSWTRFAETRPRTQAGNWRESPHSCVAGSAFGAGGRTVIPPQNTIDNDVRAEASLARLLATGGRHRRSSTHATVRVSGVPLLASADFFAPDTPERQATRGLSLHDQRPE
jgi:hypothetical protein